MSEYTLQIITICKLLWVVGFTALYGFGGISNKWLRRFVGAFWMGSGVVAFSMWQDSWHWWYSFYPILLMASLHMGYSGDELLTKIRKRSIYGLALGCSAIPLYFGAYMWPLLLFHIGLCVVASVLLGVFNITGNARSEESLISTLSTVCVLFLI